MKLSWRRVGGALLVLALVGMLAGCEREGDGPDETVDQASANNAHYYDGGSWTGAGGFGADDGSHDYWVLDTGPHVDAGTYNATYAVLPHTPKIGVLIFHGKILGVENNWFQIVDCSNSDAPCAYTVAMKTEFAPNSAVALGVKNETGATNIAYSITVTKAP
jgi:hypothetical protein